MNVEDAAYNTVHNYPGGSESLAPRLGMSPAVLNSKVRPNTRTHRLALEEADLMIGLSKDYQILQALAANHGFGLYRLEPEEGDQQSSLLGELLRVGALDGEFARTVHDALADEIITPNEMNAIGAAGHAHQAALIGLIARLRSMTGKRVTT